MPKIYNLAITFLILGVIMAEFLPNINASTNTTAYSKETLPASQSELLLEFLENQEEIAKLQQSVEGIEALSDTPVDLTQISGDINQNLTLAQSTKNSLDYLAELPFSSLIGNSSGSIPETDKPFVKDVIPPSGTALSAVYQAGGTAWYQEDDNVIVQMPDLITFKSFDISTGEEIDWLQDRLGYEPLDSPDALENYTTNYHGEIVAETETWALVKFPSGGFIKIAKPSSDFRPFLSQE